MQPLHWSLLFSARRPVSTQRLSSIVSSVISRAFFSPSPLQVPSFSPISHLSRVKVPDYLLSPPSLLLPFSSTLPDYQSPAYQRPINPWHLQQAIPGSICYFLFFCEVSWSFNWGSFFLRFLFPYPSATLPCSSPFSTRTEAPSLLPSHFLLILEPRLFPSFFVFLLVPLLFLSSSKDINLNDRP